MTSTFIIAEVGSVHDGSFGNAQRLIEAAAACGADAVKFQTHLPEAETLRDAPMPPYFKGEPRYEYFSRTGFTFDQWRELKTLAEEQNLVFLSSPFSIEAVELLERLNVSQHKVPSGEVTNLPMLEAIARTGKPVLLSSGMSSWEEIDQAVEALTAGSAAVTLLQCTSEYPCPYERVGLNILDEMRQRYGLPVGLSDHTPTIYAPLAAVALGATVIEKHFTFSRRMYGSDAPNSIEPDEFRQMSEGIRAVERMHSGRVSKEHADEFGEMKRIFQKSLVILRDVPSGGTLTPETVGVKKPGTGLPPKRYRDVVGRRAARSLAHDTVLQEADIDWS